MYKKTNCSVPPNLTAPQRVVRLQYVWRNSHSNSHNNPIKRNLESGSAPDVYGTHGLPLIFQSQSHLLTPHSTCPIENDVSCLDNLFSDSIPSSTLPWVCSNPSLIKCKQKTYPHKRLPSKPDNYFLNFQRKSDIHKYDEPNQIYEERHIHTNWQILPYGIIQIIWLLGFRLKILP